MSETIDRADNPPRWNSRKLFPCPQCPRWFISAHARADHAQSVHQVTLERPAATGLWSDLKRDAHEAFDRLWQNGEMTREDAYIWLAERLNWPRARTHIGLMRKRELIRVIELCNTSKDPQPWGIIKLTSDF